MGEQDANEMSGRCLDANANNNPLRLANKKRLLSNSLFLQQNA